MTDNIRAKIQQNMGLFRDHLTGVILPAWMDQGWDQVHGGYHEKLDGDGKPLDQGFKRLTATARQLFVLTEWSKRRSQEGCAEKAHQTADYMVRRFWDEPSQGWITKVSTAGEPSDPSHDLYSIAFAIFSLARYGKVFSDAKALELAHRTLLGVDTKMKHPLGGYVTQTDHDWKPLSLDFDQNPHMHLLEALQALNAAQPTERSIAIEEKITRLMAEVFCDPQLGIIREFFDPQGRPHPQKGEQVEPGHQFEWYWLLRGAAKRSYSETLAARAGRMFEWGVTHGIDQARGGVYDICNTQGKVTQTSKRIWPTTEFIRAAACRWRKDGDEKALLLLDQHLEILLKNYFRVNGWNEALDEKLQPTRSDMPATTSYHMTTAYLDAMAMLEG